MFNKIKELCNLTGTSGDEQNISKYIVEKAKEYANSIEVDNIGNVIAFKKGKKSSENNVVMLSAHMDEVGFIVTYVESNGLIRFCTVGGISSNVILGDRVLVGKNKILGVIGNKPQHLLNNDEKTKIANFDNMFIDIGTNSKEETLSFIDIGDFCYFNSSVENLGKNFLVGKAFDDRVGCAILLEIMRENLEYDTYFCFNTREEVGCIGAKTVSNKIKPTHSIVVECTTAGDNLGFSGHNKVCSLNNGTVISYMDKGCIYDYNLFALAKNICKKQNITHQLKSGIYGGNDAREIQKSNNGCKVLAISVPARNLHTKSIVISKSDIESTKELTLQLLNNIL